MTSFFTKSCAALLICFNGVVFANNVPVTLLSKELYRASVRHIEGGGIGYDQGYTTLEAFFAGDPEYLDVIPFLDLRGHVFDDGRLAANAGIGCRGSVEDVTCGLNFYYDYRNTTKLNYNQVGLGLELLGSCLDFRVNGYLPVGRKNVAPYDLAFAGFVDNFALISQRCQFAMKGADAEVGFHLGRSGFFDFYGAVGPYYYTGELATNVKSTKIMGCKGRLEGRYKDYVTLEVSDSYDRLFHNNFQCQLTFTLPLGRKSRVNTLASSCSCAFVSRMVQPVKREEIIVVGKKRVNTPAIDPTTKEPFFFVFVNNTSHSNGTYESPYPTFALAQANSNPGNIIYVFPGDGTTAGMNAGITLQDDQKFWGSGVSHSLQTSIGELIIPAQSSTSPIITNTDIDTAGNAITLAANNAISGFTISSARNDAIYGTNLQSLDVSSCTIENTTTYMIEASFPDTASLSITNNEFLDNVNGILLTLNGESTLTCSNNTFEGQTSISSIPLEISANNNTFSSNIENNLFHGNTTGSIRFDLNNVVDANINVLNNTFTNNGTGALSTSGSSFVIIATGTTDKCTIVLEDNSFSNNTSSASLYTHTSGQFSTLDVTASANTMSNNGAAIVLATPTTTLTLLATDNTITGCDDNGIAVIGSGSTTTGTITINNNTITDIGNDSNGIAINQDFSQLNLTISNNEISRCEGTGVLSYAPDGIDTLEMNISGNTISDCQNLSSNAAPGLDIEQFTNLQGSVTNNVFSDNTGTAVAIGSALTAPTACLSLTGNNSNTDYLLTNPVDGTFNLTPCNVESLNVGTINTSGTIDLVQSCANPDSCPP